jgi:hypothetical protein
MKGYTAFSVFLVLMVLLGYVKSMPDREIIEEVKRCETAGLDAQQVYEVWSGLVVGVQCVVPKGRFPR